MLIRLKPLRKNQLHWFHAATIAALSVPLACSAAPAGDTTVTDTLVPGVVYSRLVRESGPLVINTLQIDLRQPDLSIQSVRALGRVEGRETTSSMAARREDSLWHVVAAVNGDFFEPNGESTSTHVVEGTVVRAISHQASSSARIFSQFAFTTKTRPVIERFRFTCYLYWKGGGMNGIVGINAVRELLGPSLFNTYWGPTTRLDTFGIGTREIPLIETGNRGDTVLCVVGRAPEAGGGMAIPEKGFVLSTYHDSPLLDPERVHAGDTVRMLIRFIPPRGNLRALVGGGPRIIVDGHNVAGDPEYMEGMRPEFSSVKHPRTGIGLSRDSTTLFLVTVDGRQESSDGMTLPEFADLMISFGVYQGLNLDGGGSTTMIVGGKVANSPSDSTGERPVGNCIVVLKRKHVH